MITLWGRNNSTNVKKVRWVLEELDLPYQQILAGLEFGLNHDPEYLAMNPNGLVPLLKDDATGVVVWESNTIIRYLAAQYGVDRLWLAAPAQRAQGEKWMDWSNGTLSPAHRPVLMGLVRTPPEQRDPAAIAAGISACEALFAEGITIDGGEVCLPAECCADGDDPHACALTLQEGKFHQVKRMFEAAGNRVVYLKRISIGGL